MWGVTCWLDQALPAEGLPLLPLVQLPHGVVPQRPPLLRCAGAGARPEGPVINRTRHAADAVGPDYAVAGQSAVTCGVAVHSLGPVARHVPGQSLVRRHAERHTDTELGATVPDGGGASLPIGQRLKSEPRAET